MTTTDRTSNRLTATGAAFERPVRLRSAILVGGATGPVVELRDSTDGSGSVVLTLKCPANDSRAFPDMARPFKTGLYVTVASGNADLYVEVD